MNKKLITMLLVGVLALGGTAVAYAATNTTAPANTTDTAQVDTAQPQEAVDVEQPETADAAEKTEADEKDLDPVNTTTVVSQDQAIQIAMASITNGTYKSVSLEDENGVVVFGVEIQSGNNISDVKVDANTGAILKSDQDNDAEEQGSDENGTKDKDNDTVEHENDNEDPAGHED